MTEWRVRRRRSDAQLRLLPGRRLRQRRPRQLRDAQAHHGRPLRQRVRALDDGGHGGRRGPYRHCDLGFGSPGSAEYSLVKGKSYTFKVRWVATKLGDYPDFDWRCWINDLASAGARPALYGTGAVVIEDPDGLMTNYTDGGPDNLTLGREGKIHVPKVVFRESAPCSGFDPTLSPPWPMVPEDGANTIVAGISPAAVADRIAFEVADAGKASVSPAAAAASEQTLTLSGAAAGETEVRARLSGSGTDLAALGVSVKKRVTKSVCIHAVTEGNDDVQIIPVGQGQPNQTCITAGTNGVLNTTLAGDDMIYGNTITTGPDGICNTTASGDDVQVIIVGNGKAVAVCVTKGANNFRDTIPSGDDAVSGDDIHTGADGICNTETCSTNLVPVNVPSASALQSYLNDSTWGRQANVHFTVIRSDVVVNYDLNRDGKLADPWAYSATWAEIDVITVTAKVSTVDYNIYFAKNYEYPVALSDSSRGEAWAGDIHQGSANYVTAHEIGHLLGRVGHAGATIDVDLMAATDSSASPCRLIKIDWDYVNP